ncbi:MAG TPA: sulfurtransferase [Methylomirabilota bacterium]|jgi:thiosulfate/3-mercaptopyruvate sulfurtransferase
MRDPDALISTEDLAGRLDRPDLRVYDCTTYIEAPDPGSGVPYKVVSGRRTFLAGHIPGADFLDLQDELSAPDPRLRFTMPSAEHLARAFGGHGLGDGASVVLYSLGSMMWATRIWWMLRALGFDAAVLDGGFDRWQAEGRAIERGEPRGYPPATFTPRPRPGHFVDKTAVRAAIGDPRTVTVNALAAATHQGLEPSRYARPGRVPGSVNVPSARLVDPATRRFVPPAEALATFAAAGVVPERRVIAYCGGGIAATLDLFVLHQLGFDDLTLYDGSMSEWAADPSLPIETDQARPGA